jgi:hypothetical protein
VRQPRSDEAIRLRSTDERSEEETGVDWGMIRAVYMRILGLVWLAKGLYGGALIIGLFGRSFETFGSTEQASAAFSTIGDCIAGVGLWLTESWGAVTWIAVALVEMAFAFGGGGGSSGSAFAALAPILAYLVLGFLSARQVYDRM